MKIRLKPTKEQEQLFWQSCGAKRFAYNWGLNRAIELYKDGICFDKTLIQTEFNQYKKQFNWIDDVSAQITQHSFIDLENAFKNFYKKQCKFPRFKSKKN